MEQQCVFEDNADGLTQLVQREVADIDAIDLDRPGVDVVEPDE